MKNFAKRLDDLEVCDGAEIENILLKIVFRLVFFERELKETSAEKFGYL